MANGCRTPAALPVVALAVENWLSNQSPTKSQIGDDPTFCSRHADLNLGSDDR